MPLSINRLLPFLTKTSRLKIEASSRIHNCFDLEPAYLQANQRSHSSDEWCQVAIQSHIRPKNREHDSTYVCPPIFLGGYQWEAGIEVQKEEIIYVHLRLLDPVIDRGVVADCQIALLEGGSVSGRAVRHGQFVDVWSKKSRVSINVL